MAGKKRKFEGLCLKRNTKNSFVRTSRNRVRKSRSQTPSALIPPASKPRMFWNTCYAFITRDNASSPTSPIKPTPNILTICEKENNHVTSPTESSVLGPTRTYDRNTICVQVLPVKRAQAIFTSDLCWYASHLFTFPRLQRLTKPRLRP